MRRFKAAARTTKAFVVLLAVLALGSLGVGVLALAAPSVAAPTIVSGPANPTSATSATFTYTDSGNITSFQCALDNTTFYPCGTTRPSTHSYPDAQHVGSLAFGIHTFYVRAVSGSQTSNTTSYSWKVALSKPVITSAPDDPNGTAVSTFQWTDSDTGVSFQCSIENGPWQACTSPATFTVNSANNGTHQFAVRAVDAAGHVSDAATWSWKVNNVGFTITGNAPTLYPGVWKKVPVLITNPNHFTIYITSLTVSVASSPATCAALDNIETSPSSATTSNTLAVPAQNTNWPVPDAYQPQIRLKNLLLTNQDLCKSASFSLSYGGSATK